jgi:hypothetical protein
MVAAVLGTVMTLLFFGGYVLGRWDEYRFYKSRQLSKDHVERLTDDCKTE